jgi:DNA transformation protein
MDAESIRELFAEFGAVGVRRMFGGAGVFVEGRMIALVSREVIYLKADAETFPEFEREGLAPFSYATKNGEQKLTSYWRMPDRLYDDAEELARWARAAHQAALRAAARRETPKRAANRKARPSLSGKRRAAESKRS